MVYEFGWKQGMRLSWCAYVIRIVAVEGGAVLHLD